MQDLGSVVTPPPMLMAAPLARVLHVDGIAHRSSASCAGDTLGCWTEQKSHVLLSGLLWEPFVGDVQSVALQLIVAAGGLLTLASPPPH